VIEEEPEDEEGERKTKKKADGSDSEWDDCDLESIDSKEAANEAKNQDQEKSSISDQKDTSSFSEIDIPSADKDMGIESLSSLTSGEKEKTKHQGMTKEEVMIGLKVKKAERLHTGEVKLGNGKIMGIRKFHYIYKQKPKMPDTREAVLVNKIALEYR